MSVSSKEQLSDTKGPPKSSVDWDQVSEVLLKSISKNSYESWIEPLVLLGIEDDVASFEVPTRFIGNYVSQNFGEVIVDCLRSTGFSVSRIQFVVQERSADVSVNTGHAGDASTAMGVLEDSNAVDRGTPLDRRFTFESFVVGKSNEFAHAACRRVALGGEMEFNPLFIYGGVGLGKTHLMHSIAHELRRYAPQTEVLYLSAEQFMYRFITAIRDRKMTGFKEMFRTVDVLMVDDVQYLAGKDSTQEEFFHTFNSLVDTRKRVIISADRSPGEISELEGRIRSRLQSGLVVDVHPTDYELRLGILRAKVVDTYTNYPKMAISDDVLEFLAHKITTNVRVLEGALTRLLAFSSLVGRPIDMELAEDCLQDVLRASSRKISIGEIQKSVSEHFNVGVSDMIGPKREVEFTRPRQVAMYLSKQLTSRSLPEIGRRFGGRDHTTVMHGVRKIEELAREDLGLSEDLELLQKKLEGTLVEHVSDEVPKLADVSDHANTKSADDYDDITDFSSHRILRIL